MENIIIKITIFISTIIGMTGLLWALMPFFPYSLGRYLVEHRIWNPERDFYIFIPASIGGLILGVISFKLAKKKLAILGISFSLAALIIWIGWYLFGLLWSMGL